MNICMLASNFLPRQGGAEYAIHHLTRSLIEAGHAVTVLAAADPAARTIRFPYPVCHCPSLPWISLERQRLWHAAYHRARRRFDVIHAHIAWEAGFVAARLRRRCGVPVVITCHGGDVQVVPEIQYGLCLKPDLAAKVQFALQHADRITAVSERMVPAIVHRGGDERKIRRVGYGTEWNKIQQMQPPNLRAELGWSNDEFVVLSVGRNSPVKDMPTLIEGLRIAAAREPRLRCIFVGPDESLRGLIAQAGLGDRSRCLGRIPSGYDPNRPGEVVFQTPYPELIAAYHACDVYASTSYVESFNTSALDAFACGRTVLITNTQGFMDLLVEGVNGHSVPPRQPETFAEKLVHLARHRDLCRQMGEAGRQRAAEYDWSKVARRYLAVYAEVCGSETAGAPSSCDSR